MYNHQGVLCFPSWTLCNLEIVHGLWIEGKNQALHSCFAQSRNQKQESGLLARRYCRPFRSPFWASTLPKSQPHKQNLGKTAVTPPRKITILSLQRRPSIPFDFFQNKYVARVTQEDGMPMAEKEKSETWNTGRLTTLILKNIAKT